MAMTLIAARRGRQRGQERAVRACGCPSGRSASRWRAPWSSSAASSRSMPTRRRACSPRSTRSPSAPERFSMESNVYLGLRSIYWQLARAKSDDQLRDVVRAHVGHGGQSRGRQRLGCRSRRCARRRRRCARRWSAARATRRSRADGRAAGRARQVPAGAGRAAAQEPAAAGAPARSQCAHAAAAGSQEHDRPAGADGALRRQGRRETAPAGAAVDARKPADGPSRPAWTATATTT